MDQSVKEQIQKLLPPTSFRLKQNFEHITLTEDEKMEALRLARAEKDRLIRQEEYWKRVNTPEIPPLMNWEQFYDHVKQKATALLTEQKKKVTTLNTSDGRNHVYSQICKYFTSDESCQYNLSKGLLVMGNIGAGKSLFFKLCANNPRNSYHIFDCVKLPADYASIDDNRQPYGEKLINKFRSALGPKSMDPWRHQTCGALFDDLGWEEILKHYGNEVNVMERILSGIYSASMPFSNYHATTNLKEEELENKYGSRIASRMKEMFNFIVLPGGDMR